MRTHRRQFLHATLAAAAGTLSGGLFLPGCAQKQDKKAELSAGKKPGKKDDPPKKNGDFDDRVTEFCAKEPLGDAGGYFWYAGIGCPGELPCNHGSPVPLSYPCSCGDAGCVSLSSPMSKSAFETNAAFQPSLLKDSPKDDARVFWKADDNFKLAPTIAGHHELTVKEVCLVKVPGENEPRKVKLFVIKARFYIKPMEEKPIVVALGFEIDPKEDIAKHEPKTYEATNKLAHHCEVKKHPSNMEFTVLLKNP